MYRFLWVLIVIDIVVKLVSWVARLSSKNEATVRPMQLPAAAPVVPAERRRIRVRLEIVAVIAIACALL
jgi:hypothetical protein